MKKPFVKFIIHSASYAFFLTLLGEFPFISILEFSKLILLLIVGAASQRVEFLV